MIFASFIKEKKKTYPPLFLSFRKAQSNALFKIHPYPPLRRRELNLYGNPAITFNTTILKKRN
jgi:hypothetical protein